MQLAPFSTDLRRRVAEVILLIHLWQERHLDWSRIAEVAKLTPTEVELLDPVERDDDEPTLIRKVILAIRTNS